MKFTVKAFRSVGVRKVLGFRGCSLNVWFRVLGGGGAELSGPLGLRLWG